MIKRATVAPLVVLSVVRLYPGEGKAWTSDLSGVFGPDREPRCVTRGMWIKQKHPEEAPMALRPATESAALRAAS